MGHLASLKTEHLQLAISLRILAISTSDKDPSVALCMLAWRAYNKAVAFRFRRERVVCLSETENDQKWDT